MTLVRRRGSTIGMLLLSVGVLSLGVLDVLAAVLEVHHASQLRGAHGGPVHVVLHGARGVRDGVGVRRVQHVRVAEFQAPRGLLEQLELDVIVVAWRGPHHEPLHVVPQTTVSPGASRVAAAAAVSHGTCHHTRSPSSTET
uniref:Putative secreted protein n=1 Tax=Ixodes ricinus TaxID=34613 RepID=A0A6B0UT93_IXORI